jgi:hypothetical protein
MTPHNIIVNISMYEAFNLKFLNGYIKPNQGVNIVTHQWCFNSIHAESVKKKDCEFSLTTLSSKSVNFWVQK